MTTGPTTAAPPSESPRRPHHRLLAELLHFGWLVPATLLAYLVQDTWVNVPHSDQWSFALHLREQGGVFDLGDLAAFHNEHRLLFPRMVMIGLARLGMSTRIGPTVLA